MRARLVNIGNSRSLRLAKLPQACSRSGPWTDPGRGGLWLQLQCRRRLCALAAHHLASGQLCHAYGEPASGLIVVPQLAA
ncbi:MAG: hypothetical protein FJ077_02510 [Cyanobacteria bacterium K_DeepCast_35m_m2_023]|nr:hypothetical protein [Cyanobacteria bacterium K_DeepCast_35m_m2_023]